MSELDDLKAELTAVAHARTTLQTADTLPKPFNWRERLGNIIDHATRLGAEKVEKAVIDLLYEFDALPPVPLELDNHHNAVACLYCNPDGALVCREQLAVAEQARHLAETHALDLAGRIAFLCTRDIPNTEQGAKASLLTRLADAEQARITLQEQLEFQRARADKWVAIAEKCSIELEAAGETATILNDRIDELTLESRSPDGDGPQGQGAQDDGGKPNRLKMPVAGSEPADSHQHQPQPEVEGDRRALQIALSQVVSLFDDPCPYDTNTTLAAARAALQASEHP